MVKVMSKDSQCKAIEEYLKQGKTITRDYAEKKLGCVRLSARIYDLKKNKHLDIVADKMRVSGGKILKCYRLSNSPKTHEVTYRVGGYVKSPIKDQEIIKTLLMRGETLSNKYVADTYNCFCLSKVISNLIKGGMTIHKRWETNPYTKKRYVVYFVR